MTVLLLAEEDRSMTSTKRDLPFSSSQGVKRMKLMTSNVTGNNKEILHPSIYLQDSTVCL